MAEHLASVPEETATGFTPRNTYRDWIRTVPVSGAPIAWGLPNSQRHHNGSSYSSSLASISCPSNSNYTDSSDRTVAVFTALAGSDELRKIAHQMVRDGYTRRMVQAVNVSEANTEPALRYSGDDNDSALESWFVELDVDWVLQIRNKHGSGPELQLQDKSASSLQDLVQKWIRALTVIVLSITELILVSSPNERPSVEFFGKVSIAKMLVFLETIIPALKAENLRALLDMYICVSGSSYMFSDFSIAANPREDPSFCLETRGSANYLSCEATRLNVAISRAMEKMQTLIDEDGDWASDITRGRGEVHRNTRRMMECILSMREACASTQNSVPDGNTMTLPSLIDHTIDYLKDVLLRKSELCSNLSLRYLFLLNNLYFVCQVLSEPSVLLDYVVSPLQFSSLIITPECVKYLDRYLDVSWRHLMSTLDCEPNLDFCGPLNHWMWIKSSLAKFKLAKFEAALHKTYKAQKFWRVPDPSLRGALRRTIVKEVIGRYNYYIEHHPEIVEHVSDGNSSPDALEKMLRELFEG
ncbi:hypothetical protein ZWY2020_012081 [Hordeum vulgare]|nr:hypothetical protein ZWY2020_012081 [Hordeum vulgare]